MTGKRNQRCEREIGDRERLISQRPPDKTQESAAKLIALCHQFLLLPEREREQRRAHGDRNVLLAVYRVAHRSAVDLASQGDFPEQLPVARIEREEVALAAS